MSYSWLKLLQDDKLTKIGYLGLQYVKIFFELKAYQCLHTTSYSGHYSNYHCSYIFGWSVVLPIPKNCRLEDYRARFSPAESDHLAVSATDWVPGSVTFIMIRFLKEAKNELLEEVRELRLFFNRWSLVVHYLLTNPEVFL